MNVFKKPYRAISLRTVTIAVAGSLALASGLALAQEETSLPAESALSYAQIETIALDALPGGTIEEMEREDDDGVLVYEVEIESADKELRLEINALTGDIMSRREESKDDGLFENWFDG